MRMHAKLSSPETLYKLLLCLEQATRFWVIHFSPKYLRIIAAGVDDISAYCNLDVSSIFDQYLVESTANNEIWIMLYGDAFIRILKNSIYAKEIKIKLSKKNDYPVLCVTVRNTAKNGSRILITQEISVRICREQDTPRFNELPINNGTFIADIGKIKSICERFRNISSTAVLSIDEKGQLSLKTHTNLVSIETIFLNDRLTAFDPVSTKYKSVRCSIKDLVKIANASILKPRKSICWMTNNSQFALCCYCSPNLKCYISFIVTSIA